jgi:hypothetical protein
MGESEMARNKGIIPGVICFALSAIAAVVGILSLLARHSHRGTYALIACGVLLVVGIIFIVVMGRKAKA